MDPRELEIQRLQELLQWRLWIGAVLGVPIAVGTGLALVFFLTLAEPVPADIDPPGFEAEDRTR
ncbi:hypothetical protein L2D14_01405 [Thalassospiraceae bacterium LMO-JJ14]|nr:hypothetical protein L2D14_01405 [Thalassospiraceae bacterium LMO-JJ14]